MENMVLRWHLSNTSIQCLLASTRTNPPRSGRRTTRSKAAAGECSHWHRLDRPLFWHGDEAAAMQPRSLPASLRAPWKVMLLSDGSVTRHLQLMTGLPVAVECVEMCVLDPSESAPHPATAVFTGRKLMQRQVFLRLPEPLGQSYVYAVSWWEAEAFDQYLKDKAKPIWVSLSQERTELYREILDIEYGNSAYLESKLSTKGPFWARSYIFWHAGRPLTVIYEVFSSALVDFLGPSFQ